ncbi:hypothetical protein [Rhizobium rhizogenes]|uniref:hypothetical protein n=1 Tax=Rhizobium rhizogenes TaxID=359 RepID=UPI0024BDAF9A|nr:hypothetical protein [Rhizobium rhizogenes]
MTDRISCCVPFCTRTLRNDKGYSDWICQEHWRMTDKFPRRIYAKRKRRLKVDTTYPAKKVDDLWQFLKKQAIERAAGI